MTSFEDELHDITQRGLKRELRLPNPELINFSSNDYLGLAAEPTVRRAAIAAIEFFGVGGRSSRLLSGTSEPHVEFEQRLAAFLRKPAALLFSSGYHTNTGVIPAVAGSGDLILLDRLCHASIVDGVKLSDARFFTFEHNNMDQLETLLLSKRSAYRRVLVITESVFSMDGDAAPLKELTALCRRFEALSYVDEAHSFGVFGSGGRGWADAQGVLEQVDIFVGTLSKSLGSQGGFVATSAALRELLVSKCRSFLFTTALAPAAAAAAIEALRLFPSMEARRKEILSAAAQLREGLAALGFSTQGSVSQIVPLMTMDIEPTNRLSNHLLRKGFFVPSIRPPTVPVGSARLRLSVCFGPPAKAVVALTGAVQRYVLELKNMEPKIAEKS